jgi:hypothetical protein
MISGQAVTEKSLLPAMTSAWKSDFLPLIIDAMVKSESSLSFDTLKQVLPLINKNKSLTQSVFALHLTSEDLVVSKELTALAKNYHVKLEEITPEKGAQENKPGKK